MPNINDVFKDVFTKAYDTKISNEKVKTEKPVEKPQIAPEPQKGENVSISKEALNLSKLEKSINDTPTVDERKVAETKEKIDNGTYKINPEKIANKMIEMEDGLYRVK